MLKKRLFDSGVWGRNPQDFTKESIIKKGVAS
jgi:hypothetical protein